MTRIAVSLTLVVVAIFISRKARLRAERELSIAAVRALIQMAAVALLVDLVFSAIGWSALLLGVMLVAAATTSARRMARIARPFGIAITAIAVSSGTAALSLFATGAFPLEPRYLIPLAGMLIGNSMNATSVAGLCLREEVEDKRLEIEARLALGAPAAHALNPYVAKAVRTALIPLIDSTKNVGVVALPGAFVGMILGGASPREAAEVQLIVLFMLLGAVSIAALATVLLTSRRLIAPGDRLVLEESEVKGGQFSRRGLRLFRRLLI